MAARIMADEQVHNLATAKRKAAQRLNFLSCPMPSDADVLGALEEYRKLFTPESTARAEDLRTGILDTLRWLEDFSPWLTGPWLSGAANANTPVTLQIFTDNSKAIEMFLINQGADYRVAKHTSRGHLQPLDTLIFDHDVLEIHLEIWDEHDFKQLPQNKAGAKLRINLSELQRSWSPFISKP